MKFRIVFQESTNKYKVQYKNLWWWDDVPGLYGYPSYYYTYTEAIQEAEKLVWTTQEEQKTKRKWKVMGYFHT